MKPADWQQLLQQGISAVQERQAEKALELLQAANALQPASRDVSYWLGNAQRLCGLTAAAEGSFRSLLARLPADFDVAMALAFLLREQGRSTELGVLLLDFARQPSAPSEALLKIAGFLRDSNHFGQAIEVMHLALASGANQAINYFRLARLYQGTGQHEAALQAYREALQRDAGLGGAWLGLATLQKFTDPDQADWRLIRNAAVQAENIEAAMCLAFARGKGHDDLEQYEQAWNSYLEGNRLRHLSQSWDQAGWQEFVQQSLTQACASMEHDPGKRKPVFIVGMLRSGTTLLEQLLDQHPTVTARGELNFVAHAWASWQQVRDNPSAAEELAAQLWKHMQLDGSDDHYYVDKNPLNFRFLPMLAAILPEAKILHLLRDGRDSCLSCIMQLFQHPDTAFANQLDDLLDYYHGYLRLMQHFRRNMPAQILTLNYSDLVTDTESTIQAVKQFLGLINSEFDHATEQPQRPIRTASAWQARQQIHRNSLGRWQNYYAMAPDFFDRIQALDEEFNGTL